MEKCRINLQTRGETKYVIADKPTIKEIGVALAVYKNLWRTTDSTEGNLT